MSDKSTPSRRAASPPRPGTMVTDSVELVEPLMAGGMGVVWTARHHALNADVAVKFITDINTASEEERARFTREATAAASIKSPHVVKTFDQGVMGDGTPYIIMELLEGESLGDLMERDGQLRLRDVALILTQTCKALAAAHKLGIVHRDVKPDNIFVCKSLEGIFVKILDFGIAKQTELAGVGLTAPQAVMGTPEYMSPEQVVSSKAVDFQADLWGLAAVAYEAVTSEPPFWAETDGALLVAILTQVVAPPRVMRDDLPPEVDAWFEQALHKDVTKRFGSAMEMARRFAAMVPGVGDIDGEWANSSLDLSFNKKDDGPLGDLAELLGENPSAKSAAPALRSTPVPNLAAPPVEARAEQAPDEPSDDPISGAVPAPRKRRSSWLAVIVGVAAGLSGVVAATLAGQSAAPPSHEADPMATKLATSHVPSAAPTSSSSRTPSADAAAATTQPAANASASASSSVSTQTVAPPRRPPRKRPRPPPSKPAPAPSTYDHGF